MLKLFIENNIKLFFINLILVTILISTGFIVLNHNDFHYYGSTVVSGQLYKDIYFLYPPGTFIFNKAISILFPNDYNYVLMRISSISLFILSINILANSFLKKNEKKIYFLLFASLLCSSAALEIGSYTLSFFFFVLSLVKFFFGKNNKEFFWGGFFFGLCLSTRSTYAYCVFFFLVIILKDNNWKKYFLYSTLGGILGILPYVFFFFKDFNSVIFWNFKFHLLLNEAGRWRGSWAFIKSVVYEIYTSYIVITPLLLHYLYYLYKNIHKRFFEFILLVILAASSLTVLVSNPQYFEPLFIIILLFIIKHIDLSYLSRFLIISLIIISVGKFLYAYDNLDKSKYSYKYIHSIFSILNTKKEIKSVIDSNFNKECSLVFRTTSPIYLPHGLIHHYFNLSGAWLFRLKELKEKISMQSNKVFDYNNYLNFYKNDFNALFVGYYSLGGMSGNYELELIKYAEKENWKLFNITNFKLYIKNECIKK
jgi:hypothetical protein